MADAGREATEFILERVFAAPPPVVWRAWTEPALLARWYKPDPTCQTAVLQYDLRPGGVMRYEMRFGTMPAHYERWEFVAIEPPSRLRWRQMLTDADGTVTGSTMVPDWPRVMLTTIELEAHAAGTLQRLRWQPYDATAAEIAGFRNATPYLDKGWAGGFTNLGELLKELAAT